MWYYNELEGSLTNAANPGYKLDQTKGWLFLADLNAAGNSTETIDKDFPVKPAKWFFEDQSKGLTTLIDGVKSQVTLYGPPAKWGWAEVGTSEYLSDKLASQFVIEPCFHN